MKQILKSQRTPTRNSLQKYCVFS